MFFSNFGDVNLRQVNASTTLFARAVEVNTLAQGSLRWFTPWPWIKSPNLPTEKRTLKH